MATEQIYDSNMSAKTPVVMLSLLKTATTHISQLKMPIGNLGSIHPVKASSAQTPCTVLSSSRFLQQPLSLKTLSQLVSP